MSDPQPPRVCLASASPRRRELLAQIGVACVVQAAHVDETRLPNESARDYVVRLARTKAQVVYARDAALPVLGADTTVALGEEIFGKPASRAGAVAMLMRLSGRTHQVLTAVALVSARGLAERLTVSRVTFRTLTEAECGDYWDTGEPRDKAGGYAIQGRAAAFIAHLEGSFSGVMGLPLFETAELLGELSPQSTGHGPQPE